MVKALKDNGFENQGNISLGVFYFFWAISSLIAKPIVKKLTMKVSMILGSLTYGLIPLVFLLPGNYDE